MLLVSQARSPLSGRKHANAVAVEIECVCVCACAMCGWDARMRVQETNGSSPLVHARTRTRNIHTSQSDLDKGNRFASPTEKGRTRGIIETAEMVLVAAARDVPWYTGGVQTQIILNG